MTNKEKKAIRKEYWSNDQRLYITTMEQMDPEGENDFLTVYTYDKKNKKYGTWLFDIRNWNSFREYYKNSKGQLTNTYGTETITSTPKYMEKMVTLTTFKSITVQDILTTVREVLKKEDMWLIFNVVYLTELEIEKIERKPLIFDEKYLIF